MPSPLNVEKELMHDLGFKRLQDLEAWLADRIKNPPPELLARFEGSEEDLEEEEGSA